MGGSISCFALRPAKDDRYLTVDQPYENHQRVTLGIRDSRSPYQTLYLQRVGKGFYMRFAKHPKHFLCATQQAGKWVVTLEEHYVEESQLDTFRWKAVILAKRKTALGNWTNGQQYHLNYGKMKTNSLLVAFINESTKTVLSFDSSGLNLVSVGEGVSDIRELKDKVLWEAECVGSKWSARDKHNAAQVGRVFAGITVICCCTMMYPMLASRLNRRDYEEAGSTPKDVAAHPGERVTFDVVVSQHLTFEESFFQEQYAVSAQEVNIIARAVAAEGPISGFTFPKKVYDHEEIYQAGFKLLVAITRTL